MKAKLHKQHPLFLKLQDIVEFSEKLQQPCEVAIRNKNGKIIKRQSLFWTLHDYLHEDNRKEDYILDGRYIYQHDLLQTNYDVLNIVKAVELLGEITLEGFEINSVISCVDAYNRTKYVLDKLEIEVGDI